METLGYFPAILRHRDCPLSALQLCERETKRLVTPFGIGAHRKIQAGALVDAQGAYFHIRQAHIVSVQDRPTDISKNTVELTIGRSQGIFDDRFRRWLYRSPGRRGWGVRLA